MTSEEAKKVFEYLEKKANTQEPCDVFDEYGNYKYPSDVELTEPNTATSMPCDDAISREDAIESIANIDETDGTVAIFTGKQVIALLKDLPFVNAIQHTSNASKDVEQHTNTLGDAVSREAVLDIVCGNYEKDGWGESNFYKAIEQLPSVNPQKSGKCESELIKDLIEQPAKVYIDKTDYQQGYIDGVNQMVKELKVERQKSGKWIDKEISNPDYPFQDRKIIECSKCHFGIVQARLGYTNYCPNCGAKMVEPQESKDIGSEAALIIHEEIINKYK